MHTLVVGGTGMLSEVSMWLVEQGYTVSVIGRRFERLNTLVSQTGPYAILLNRIVVDYRVSTDLQGGIDNAIAHYGPVDLAVYWIHSDAPDAFRVIADKISHHAGNPWKLFHVRGSATHLEARTPSVPDNCLYRQVILGFVLEGKGSRWLTHGEISGGVIKAILQDEKQSVVGTLEPWENRPI